MTIKIKSALVVACLFITTHLSIGEETTNGSLKSLSDRLVEWHKQMADTSVEAKKAALEGLLPTKADIQLLFPNGADKLWEKLSMRYEQMKMNIDKVAEELARDEWIDIKVIDVRKDDPTGRYEKVLQVIPKDIPVCRIIKTGKRGGSAGSGSYLFVKGRWIFLQGLEAIPDFLNQ
ncbi:hypothetical protein [Prosthecobacter sp.]|uniref:hypothetical protein n=1 Tax=Prosthecobacter sp. TaxID=1965333 RepID=UPI003784C1CA